MQGGADILGKEPGLRKAAQLPMVGPILIDEHPNAIERSAGLFADHRLFGAGHDSQARFVQKIIRTPLNLEDVRAFGDVPEIGISVARAEMERILLAHARKQRVDLIHVRPILCLVCYRCIECHKNPLSL